MKKVSATGNSEKDWMPVKSGDKGKEDKHPGGGGTHKRREDDGDEFAPKEEDPGEPKMPSEDELKEHAKNSSETALSNAVKQSNNPTVRQVAQAEIKRRLSEEKPQDDKEKDVFPSKEVTNGGGKKDEKKPEKVKFAEKPATNLKSENKDSEKESKDLQEKHKKEIADFQDKQKKSNETAKKNMSNLIEKHRKEAKKLIDSISEDFDSKDMAKQYKEMENKHNKEQDDLMASYDKMLNDNADEFTKLTEKHNKEKDSAFTGNNSEVKKAITGIQYF
jgi:hypothetical protein